MEAVHVMYTVAVSVNNAMLFCVYVFAGLQYCVRLRWKISDGSGILINWRTYRRN